MRYTLDHYCYFNWYHWILSIGINIDIFLYTHIFLCMYAYSSNCINFDWYLIFHTYIWFICAYYIPIFLSTNFDYTKLGFLTILFQLISFQLVFLYKLMHYFCWYFIKREKTCILSFNWYLISTPTLYDEKD